MSEAISHPTLQQFRKALNERGVTPDKARQFDGWRKGAKCTGELKAAADALWAEYEGLGKGASTNTFRQQAPAAAPQRGGGGGRPFDNRGPRGGGFPPPAGRPANQPAAAINRGAAKPDILGEAFHNPYTFLPFPEMAPERMSPTLFSIDEVELDRFTGVLDLEVKLLSPLLTNAPDPIVKDADHKEYQAQKIGDDIIVPATGVKGSLRTLMTLLTGGTLGYVDEEAWLCQGRDANLGPAGKMTEGKVPKHAFLARVVSPGGFEKSGTIELGQTDLIKADDLENLARQCGIGDLPRPKPHGRVKYLWMNDEKTVIAQEKSDRYCWQLKLSGRPIMRKGKREGLFLGSGKTLQLSSTFWAAYSGRNRHGDYPELKKGDLVWLEPRTFGTSEIRSADDIKSIQWARWGREGEGLLEVIARDHHVVLPDSLNPDGLVDEVTNLFGHIPREDKVAHIERFRDWEKQGMPGPAPKFAGRVRTGNLVFENASKAVRSVTLAPLAPPHPGCAAFYRGSHTPGDLAETADQVCNHKLPLRGFKVYRNTSERGKEAPWHFAQQGVYGERGELKSPQQRVNKTAELLIEDQAPVGRLRISLRAMSKRELALVLSACAVDWRLGGGKPLGLGHCRVESATLREFHDDGTFGTPVVLRRETQAIASLPEPYAAKQDEKLLARMRRWQASQTPVEKLRYPRAVDENQNKKNRGGHTWFMRHAQPRKIAGEDKYPVGLQIMHLAGDMAASAGTAALRAQPLPFFDPANPQADTLHGYDLIVRDDPQWREQARNRSTMVKQVAPFDEKEHARNDASGGFQGQNRQNRQDGRDGRRPNHGDR